MFKRTSHIVTGALTLAIFILPGLTSASTKSARGGYGFNPDINAPRNYDPSSPGIVGPGNDTASGGCRWTREQAYVGGQLKWRPLLQCYYGW